MRMMRFIRNPVFSPLVLILFFFCSCSHGKKAIDKKQNDTTYFKTTLVPLKYKEGETIIIKADSAKMIIIEVQEDNLIATENKTSIKYTDMKLFDHFIKTNKSRIENLQFIIVACLDKISLARIKEVIAILTNNGINRFNLQNSP
jgi:hypothetical protein